MTATVGPAPRAAHHGPDNQAARGALLSERCSAGGLGPGIPARSLSDRDNLRCTQTPGGQPCRVSPLMYAHTRSNRAGRCTGATDTRPGPPPPRRPPRPRGPMPGADPAYPARRNQPAGCCTWCGHPDHPTGCTVTVGAAVCPCARSLPASPVWPAGTTDHHTPGTGRPTLPPCSRHGCRPGVWRPTITECGWSAVVSAGSLPGPARTVCRGGGSGTAAGVASTTIRCAWCASRRRSMRSRPPCSRGGSHGAA